MKKSEYYNLTQQCAKENGAETIKRSDILTCKKFGCICTLVNCLNNHNGTKIGEVL